jgi:hypothetical protein
MTQADTPMPGADLQPSDNPPGKPEQPQRKAPSIPEEDDPEVKDTEVQPT